MSWSKVLLIGDSLTQVLFPTRIIDQFTNSTSNGAYSNHLAFTGDGVHCWQTDFKVADVITRGFSGYNTRWCKYLLPNILDSINMNELSCVTIFLGANDCSLPSSGQHVPVNEFQQNLEYMVDYLESRSVSRQKIVFITPPIYFQSDFAESCLKQGKTEPLRSDERPGIYALAMIELGQRLHISVVDAHSAFLVDGRGSVLFSDGLHFSPEGSDLLYNLMVKDIETRVLAFRGESLTTETMNYAHWMDVDPKMPEQSIFGKKAQ